MYLSIAATTQDPAGWDPHQSALVKVTKDLHKDLHRRLDTFSSSCFQALRGTGHSALPSSSLTLSSWLLGIQSAAFLLLLQTSWASGRSVFHSHLSLVPFQNGLVYSCSLKYNLHL